MSFDTENVFLKIFAEFSNSAKKRETLKEYFEFCESDFREVIRHVPTRWLSLLKAVDRVILSWRPIKSYFLALGSDECPAAVWVILSDQEDEMFSDAEPSYFELYLYFTHNFMSNFQSVLLLLEKMTTIAYNIYKIMENLRNSLKKNDKFLGMKVHFALHKYLPRNLIAKFESEALKVYTLTNSTEQSPS
jgi:hypothetical protein